VEHFSANIPIAVRADGGAIPSFELSAYLPTSGPQSAGLSLDKKEYHPIDEDLVLEWSGTEERDGQMAHVELEFGSIGYCEFPMGDLHGVIPASLFAKSPLNMPMDISINGVNRTSVIKNGWTIDFNASGSATAYGGVVLY